MGRSLRSIHRLHACDDNIDDVMMAGARVPSGKWTANNKIPSSMIVCAKIWRARQSCWWQISSRLAFFGAPMPSKQRHQPTLTAVEAQSYTSFGRHGP